MTYRRDAEDQTAEHAAAMRAEAREAGDMERDRPDDDLPDAQDRAAAYAALHPNNPPF